MILACGLAVFLLGSTATAALASPFDRIPSVTVHFEELDLSRPAGARVLYKRIERAAFKVCEDSVGAIAVRRIKTGSCYQNAVANAVAEVNRPQLYAIHRASLPRLASE
jgi:UrcA family protein